MVAVKPMIRAGNPTGAATECERILCEQTGSKSLHRSHSANCVNFASELWSSVSSGCIRGHNNWTFDSVIDLEACKARCIELNTCCSIDYKPEEERCHLSRYTKGTVEPNTDYTEPCYLPGWKYVERVDSDCKKNEQGGWCDRLN